MSGFDQREQSFEAKYKRDQETLFRITSRRNRLLGLWVAEQLGMPDNQALDYAKEVVLSDFEEPGDEDVVRVRAYPPDWDPLLGVFFRRRRWHFRLFFRRKCLEGAIGRNERTRKGNSAVRRPEAGLFQRTG